MRNHTLRFGVALATLAVLGGCGGAGKPAPAGQQPTSPAPSTPPDDVSLELPSTAQQIVTYSDRDNLDHAFEVTVGRSYALYVRCRGDFFSLEISDGGPPWFPPCDGVTNMMQLSDGPGTITVRLSSTKNTRWTFAAANEKDGAK